MERADSHAIFCKDVKKTYGVGTTAVEALRGVNLELKEGELLMVVGPSGSGKTTLISIIAGVLNQDHGDCIVFGTDLKELSNGDRTKYRGKNIGFVFQAFNLIPMLTAKENVTVPLLINGMEYEEASQKAEELLKSFDLQDKLNETPNNLSGGQQQRVAIARSCIHDPRLIVCDEPTSALDHETGHKVLKLLKAQVLETKRALIIVTHDERIFEFADRIVKLDDGRIIENTLK